MRFILSTIALLLLIASSHFAAPFTGNTIRGVRPFVEGVDDPNQSNIYIAGVRYVPSNDGEDNRKASSDGSVEAINNVRAADSTRPDMATNSSYQMALNLVPILISTIFG